MVKRTLLVLSILSLMVCAAGTSSAFVVGWPDSDCVAKPLYVPVDCWPYPEAKTIIKTWSCKIEGPCPAPGPVCGPAACKKDGFAPGMLCAMAGAIASPFDLLFGGFDGTYGCLPGVLGGKGGCDAAGSCGPCFGPVPAIVAAVPMALGAPTVMFGSLW